MCVIAYKPKNLAFPEEKILENCFWNNSDGAGFMYAYKGNVHFQKGYQTFKSFMNALNKARAVTGDNVPYVMHFRIATQGYEKTMTHPFPLSSNMKKLKKLHGDCNIGIAHNGILDITSDGSRQYSDTMKFITDYLSLIIRKYSWFKDERTKMLIERLIEGSRLSILDKNGHCELMGEGWEQDDNGIWYSNHSWAREPYEWGGATVAPSHTHWDEDWYDDGFYFKRLNDAVKATDAALEEAEKKGSGSNNKAPVTATISDAKGNRTVVRSDGSTHSVAPLWCKPVTPVLNDPYACEYNQATGKYNFKEDDCPLAIEDSDEYCPLCANATKCGYYRAVAGYNS